MPQTVIYADAPALIIGHLNERLAVLDTGTPVAQAFSKPPFERPDRFVVVTRTGGQARSVITDEPQITVEAWAPSDDDVAKLILLVRGIVHAMARNVVDGVPIYRVVEFGGPSELPDPHSTSPRMTFTAAVHMRAADLLA